MSLIRWIDDTQPLPHPSVALGPGTEAPGLVAAGGRVTPARLEEAYRAGIFPWYSPGQPALWWSPDPRMVLPVAEFRLSHTLRKTIRRFLRTPGCEIRFDHDLAAVIDACARTPREGQDGTWIVPEVRDAYVAWGAMGRVHSVETWVQGRLAGGLYLVQLGRMAYGESMFSRHRRQQDRAGGAGGGLPPTRHRLDRLPAEHAAPVQPGRARGAARGLPGPRGPQLGGRGPQGLGL